MRILGPAALTAASLVLVIAADGGAVDPEAVPAAIPAAAPVAAVAPAAVAAVAPAPAPVARAVPPWKPIRRVLPDLTRRRRDAMPAEVWSGAGFDACNAPSLDTLRAWRGTSPYGALGVYTSGGQRACDQARLSADWVRQARAMGWKLVPTHVGLQAPCTTNSHQPQRIDPAKAVQQGRDEAATAVRALQNLGFAKGSPVYLDIESYPRGDASCSQAVIDFTQGWTQALHRAGYHAGFYSSTDSGIADLAAAARAGSSPLPDAVWYAGWDDRASVSDGSGALRGDLWAAHGRIHQHHGNAQESYGGAALTVDRDQLDALVGR